MTRTDRRRWLAGALAATLLAAMPAHVLAAEQAAPAVPAMAPPRSTSSRPIPAVRPTPQLSQEEALAKLKEHLPVPEETATVTVQGWLNSSPDRLAWDFQVQIREGNSTSGYGFATVDATTGRILQYSGLHPQPGYIKTGPWPAPRPEAEAREQAWNLVQQLYPEAAHRLKPSAETAFVPIPSDSPAEAYAFQWVEYINGVPMPASQVTVAVDKATLEVTHLSYSVLDGIKLPDATPKVTREQAVKLWQETVTPRLRYRPTMEYSSTGMTKVTGYDLVYEFEGASLLVDAMTGAFSEARGPVQAPREAKPVPEGKEPSAALPLGPITDEAAAIKVAADLLQAPADAQLIVESAGSDPGALSVRLLSPTGGSNVQFDRQTGLIRHAWRYAPYAPSPAAKVTPAQEEQARQVALSVVQQFFSPIRSQLRLEPTPDVISLSMDNRLRRFHFRRYVNGVPAGYDSVQVNVDLQSMTWRDMYSNWTTGVEFPALSGVISPDKALVTLFAKQKAELIYQPVIKYYPAPVAGRLYEPPTEAALVYQLSGPMGLTLNAYTGAEYVTADNTPGSMDEALKLIADHWAEGELRHMLRLRLLTPATLNPGAPLTRAEAVEWLLRAQLGGYGYSQVALPFDDLKESAPAFSAVASAYEQGWLRPVGESTAFRPADKATRAEFAVWAMRMLGLGNLARTKLAVQDRYSDLSGLTPEQRNAANFLEALALIPSGEKFRGAEPISQAEAAALLVRLLNLRVVR